MLIPIWVAPSLIMREQPLQVSTREVNCLAENIYYEARNQSIVGQIAVAQVTINRMQHDSMFKSSICGVVHEKSQFSWTLSKVQPKKEPEAWNMSKALAKAVIDGYARIPNFDALYYHTDKVNPKWNRKKQPITKIGSHIFYL